MSDTKDIVEGYNAGYIIQQKRPEVFKQLEDVLNEVELSFFDAFAKGGIESKEERLKSLIQDKNIGSHSETIINKDDLDIEIDF